MAMYKVTYIEKIKYEFYIEGEDQEEVLDKLWGGEVSFDDGEMMDTFTEMELVKEGR